MTVLEINLPEALMDFQVLAVDEGRYNLLSGEWMGDRGVLRAVLVAAGTIEGAMQRLKVGKRQISAELAQAVVALD